MKLKSFMKKAAALAAAAGCLLLDVTAYAAVGTFNTMYSGKLSNTEQIYMNVSKENAILTKIIYPISPTTDRFVSTEDPDEFIFDASQFFAKYDHVGRITQLDGTFVGYTAGNVHVETRKVEIDYKVLWVKTYSVTFNEYKYKS